MNSPIFLLTTVLIFVVIVPSAMAQDYGAQLGYLSGFVKNAPMPIDVKIHSGNAIIKSATWHLNTRDHNYHIKGFVENTVPRATSVGLSIDFWDDVTSVSVYPHGFFNYEPSGGC